MYAIDQVLCLDNSTLVRLFQSQLSHQCGFAQTCSRRLVTTALSTRSSLARQIDDKSRRSEARELIRLEDRRVEICLASEGMVQETSTESGTWILGNSVLNKTIISCNAQHSLRFWQAFSARDGAGICARVCSAIESLYPMRLLYVDRPVRKQKIYLHGVVRENMSTHSVGVWCVELSYVG